MVIDFQIRTRWNSSLPLASKGLRTQMTKTVRVDGGLPFSIATEMSIQMARAMKQDGRQRV